MLIAIERTKKKFKISFNSYWIIFYYKHVIKLPSGVHTVSTLWILNREVRKTNNLRRYGLPHFLSF